MDNRLFDETYSIKYNKIRNRFMYFFFINSCICIIGIILYVFRIIRTIDVMICYIFFSMMIFVVIGFVYNIMYWNDFEKQKNGESQYLKEYYPHVWEKIHLYGELYNMTEYRKYDSGKYIPKNTDPVIDKIRNEKTKDEIIFCLLPFILMIFFIIIILINS